MNNFKSRIQIFSDYVKSGMAKERVLSDAERSLLSQLMSQLAKHKEMKPSPAAARRAERRRGAIERIKKARAKLLGKTVGKSSKNHIT